ncbi:hypothetical protein FA95DRAFT_1575068 [Auriscalpium vulgare]|uniref:Uncharacterized protein n=1 Tax=Auriscalpium vulgare TaxID=40419 RepID=A0ACB8RHZ4_9AGAM|nr:hypothetical protein FA95DRAFT_1575068 [Auriscalpium vulgare]
MCVVLRPWSLTALNKLRERISIFRGDFKDTASGCVIPSYGLNALEGTARKAAVDQALLDYAYIFPGSAPGGLSGAKMRNRPYMHPSGISVLQRTLFSGGDTSFSALHPESFPTYIDPAGVRRRQVTPMMVALAFTSIYAGLREYATGEKKDISFTANAYTDVYLGHIVSLEHTKQTRIDAYNSMMATIYSRAQGTGQPTVTIPTASSIAAIDFAGMEDIII